MMALVVACAQADEMSQNEETTIEETLIEETTDEEPSSADEKPTIVVSMWGGFTAEKYTELVFEPFAEQYGVEIILDTGSSGERLGKLIATKDNPEVDVFYITDHQAAIASKEGALWPNRKENFENIDDLYDWAQNPDRKRHLCFLYIPSTWFIL